MLDPPWDYKHIFESNVPKYPTLKYKQLQILPISKIAKQDCILLMWSTGPQVNQALNLIKTFHFRYVTIFQTIIKMRNGRLAKLLSKYSTPNTELLLWAEKGRTVDLKTPDVVPQVIYGEITIHSEKPYDEVFKNLMQKCHLNRMKCIEIFARGPRMRYFDIYGDELQPRFQEYQEKVQQMCLNTNILDELPTIRDAENESEKDRLKQVITRIKFDQKYTDNVVRIMKKHHNQLALSKDEMSVTPIRTHKIRIKENAFPCKMKSYRLSPKESEFQSNEVALLEKLGCIEKAHDNDWIMPVIMVKKKDTPDLRMCIDFRPLNKEMIIENYPIPRIDEILETLGKAKYFTKLDIKSGFWQVFIEPEHRHYTGFITSNGVYRWIRMPFGLKNAPATFQSIMEQALSKYLNKCCKVYIDDILIYSETAEQHEKDVCNILTALKEAQLKAGADKCEFFKTQIEILGHKLSNGKITPLESKIQAILDIPQPQNKSQIRSFVGLCSYYRSFIENFNAKIQPLLQLTTNKAEFKWTEICQTSFNFMKQELVNKPILQTPIQDKQFILNTDFSEKGLGAVLSQQISINEIRVIEYASRALRGAEVNYPAYEGEVLAIHWALHKFRYYLHGRNFKIITDNKALQTVLSKESKSNKIIRWIIDLQDYEFETKHRMGKDNQNADALSRLTTHDVKMVKLNNNLTTINAITLQQPNYKQILGTDLFVNNHCYRLEEGIGDIPCKICSDTHTRVDMLICECCGQGYHTNCLNPPIKTIPQDSYYCPDCIEKWRKGQIKDITMNFILIQYLKDKKSILMYDDTVQRQIRKIATNYNYRNNRLYRLSNQYGYLLIPTIAERKLLLLEQHRLLAHPSIDRLMSILEQNYYWYKMKEDIQQAQYDCQICQAKKLNLRSPENYIPTEKGHRPFHTISIDLAPELTITSRKNRHLAIIVDNFTKFTILIPLTRKDAQTIENSYFKYFISTFGINKIIKCDQGNEFKGDFDKMCQTWGIQVIRATARHPQANGLAEKMVHVTKNHLINCINDPAIPYEWDEAIYLVQMVINSSKTKATNLSPYELVFGRTMELPTAIIYNQPLEYFQEPTDWEQKKYYQQLQKHIIEIHKTAQIRRKEIDTIYKKAYEKSKSQIPHEFQPNQLVFLKNSSKTKWALPNQGPYMFLEYTDKNRRVAKLKNLQTFVITKQAVQNLTPWKTIPSGEFEPDSEQIQPTLDDLKSQLHQEQQKLPQINERPQELPKITKLKNSKFKDSLPKSQIQTRNMKKQIT